MASGTSKAGMEGDHNPWAPGMPDLLGDEPSPQASPEEPLEQPPQYFDTRHSTAPAPSPSSSSASRAPLPIPVLPLHKYIIPSSTLNPDQTTTTTKHAPLYDNCDQLLAFLKDQVLLPPKPILRVVGQHKEWSHGTITDFDLKLNLTPLLIRTENQSWSYLRFPPPTPQAAAKRSTSKRQSQQIPSHASLTPPQSLADLSSSFTTDPSPSKSLTLTRTTTHLDRSYLQGQILALLSTLHYAGSVSITFPNTYSSVTIQKGTALEQTWRSMLNTAASWITLGKPSAKPTTYSVDVVWPFATSASGEAGRRCAVQGEVEWWGTWNMAVQNAVLSGRRGWVGVEDWAEASMGWREEARREEWGASDGANGVR